MSGLSLGRRSDPHEAPGGDGFLDYRYLILSYAASATVEHRNAIAAVFAQPNLSEGKVAVYLRHQWAEQVDGRDRVYVSEIFDDWKDANNIRGSKWPLIADLSTGPLRILQEGVCTTEEIPTLVENLLGSSCLRIL
jgi:hypothetical protein